VGLLEICCRKSLFALVAGVCGVKKKSITTLYGTDQDFRFIRELLGEPATTWVICETRRAPPWDAGSFPVGVMMENSKKLSAIAFHWYASRRASVTLKKKGASRRWVIPDETQVGALLRALGEGGRWYRRAGSQWMLVESDLKIMAEEREMELSCWEP
jgi:hypothetical protein